MKKHNYLYYYNPQKFKLIKWKLEDWLAFGILAVWIGVVLVALTGILIVINEYINL